jgi:hypothetical protein
VSILFRAATAVAFQTTAKRRWRKAETLQDVGDLVADWLEGRLRYNPGYGGRGDPDPETREIAGELAAANRSGYVTHQSQPGWGNMQRAAVEGFANDETAGHLVRLARRTELIVIESSRTPRRRIDSSRAVPAIRYSSERISAFGHILSRRYIGYLVESHSSFEALTAARQVCLVDPAWGRNSVLWPLLTKFAEKQSPQSCGRSGAEGGEWR